MLVSAVRPQRRARQRPEQPKLVDVPIEKPVGWSSDMWGTPPEMVAAMEAEFGAFDLDPCAMPETAKAPKFYTPFENGLIQTWRGRVWLNPPYSNPEPWLRRAVCAAERRGSFHSPAGPLYRLAWYAYSTTDCGQLLGDFPSLWVQLEER